MKSNSLRTYVIPASIRNFLVLFAILLPAAVISYAQGPTTGTPPFSSTGGVGPDAINLANLNTQWIIPILHKPGRGTDFSYDLSLDSSVWYPSLISGSNTWTPVVNWGWRAVTEAGVGFVSYNQVTTPWCLTSGGMYAGTQTAYSNWVYHDKMGAPHYYNFTTYHYHGPPAICSNAETSTSASGTSDSYTLSATAGVVNSLFGTTGQKITTPINVGTGAGRYVDRNGNILSADSSGHFYDTLSSTTPVLTVSGVGTVASPLNYTYTSSAGAATYTVNYTNYTLKTNFGVTGVNEYTSGAAVPLVSSIDLPDGSHYFFTYEATPGSCSPIPGTSCVTARVASVTVPTGGVISYLYNNNTGAFPACTTGNNGIFSDGSASCLKRQTPDGIWTYVQTKGTAPASSTTVTAPALAYDPGGSNQTVLQFEGIYETQRQIYQGAATGAALQTTTTCYNLSCTATAPTLPISQRMVTATVPGTGGLYTRRLDNFDFFGNLTVGNEYDFSTSPTGSAPLRTTQITYASAGSHLDAFVQTTLICNPGATTTLCGIAGTPVSRTDITYDQYTGFTGSNCHSGLTTHDDTGHGCSFTTRANPTSITTYPDAATTSGAITKNLTYDSLGNLLTTQADCCQLTTYTYPSGSGYAYPDTSTLGSSPTFTMSYTYNNNMGLPLTLMGPNGTGSKTTITYDNIGRPLTSITGSNPQTSYTYNDSGTWYVKVCTPTQGTSTICQKSILDSLGRPVTTLILDGSATLYSATDTQYDAYGRAYRTSNPYTSTPFSWSETRFDALGRVVKIYAQDSSLSTFTYNDNTVTTSDPTSVQRKTVMDALGRISAVYEPPATGGAPSVATTYAYNLLDQLTGVTQSSQTRTMVYDSMGRLLSSTTPEAGKVCFGTMTGSTCNADGYGSSNNLLKRTDARGVLTTYGYDGLNRPSSISYNIGSSGVATTSGVTLTYGNSSTCNSAHGLGCIGQVITMTDGVGSENYTYNVLGQMTQLSKVIGSSTYPMNYTYNYSGQLASIQYPSGRTITNTLDAVGRLSSVAGNLSGTNTTYTSGYSYNPASQPTGFQYGNNIYASYGFNSDRLQLNCIDYSTTNRAGSCAHDGTTKFGINLGYGSAGSNNGFIRTIADSVDNGRSATYTYDALYRLSTAGTTGSTGFPTWGLSWIYDIYGNRTDQNVTAGTSMPMNHVTVSPTTNQITTAGYSYDFNGNTKNDSFNTMTYDAENRNLTAVNGSQSGEYSYDGDNLRIKKCVPNCTSPTTTTVYVFSGSKVIAEYDNGAAVASPSREYIYSGPTFIAKIEAGGSPRFYHQDHLSVRLMTDSTGTTVGQRGDFPYGEKWYESGVSTKLAFTTYERDAESGNDYAMARNYISRIGRFNSPDPLPGALDNPQSLNRYTYVLNNPINLIDPSGQYCVYRDLTVSGFPTETIDYDCNKGDCLRMGSYCRWVDDGNPIPDPGGVGVVVNGGDGDGGGGNLPPGGCASFYQNGVYIGNVCDGPSPGSNGGGGHSSNRTKSVNQCAAKLSQAGSVTNLSGGHVPELLGSNTFGDVSALITGSGGVDQVGALGADALTHAAPAIAGQVAVGTVVSIGKSISHNPGVYNPLTVGVHTARFGGTTIGKLALGSVEGLLTGKVFLDAGVYVGSLVVCSIQD